MSEHAVKVIRGAVSEPYRELGTVKAMKRAKTVFHKRPSEEDVDAALREEAAKKGANAVIETTYKSGISATSWKMRKGEGKAVVLEASSK